MLFYIFIKDLNHGAECTLSKPAGHTKLGVVGVRLDGCAAVQRDLDTLEK